MLEFVSGPLVWIAFVVFFGGLIFRLVTTYKMAAKERVVLPTMDAPYGTRSLAHWVTPFGTHNMRANPVMTTVSFFFHVCLLLTPLFLLGHVLLWRQSWGFGWWTLPDALADVMTLVVIGSGCFFLVRRLARPEVRNVTFLSDYLLLLLVMAPFVTGYIAHQQWLPYEATLILHIITGAAWLIAIPFTRLVHMLWFPFTRAYMGSEFGSVRHARDW